MGSYKVYVVKVGSKYLVRGYIGGSWAPSFVKGRDNASAFDSRGEASDMAKRMGGTVVEVTVRG